MVVGAVLLEEVDLLTDSIEGSVEVSSCLTPMACRCTDAKDRKFLELLNTWCIMVVAWSLDESFKRMNEDSPTGIVETLQIPNDVVNVSTDIRVCDVYNVFYHSGK